MVWFSNVHDYIPFRSQFQKIRSEIKVPYRQSSSTPNRVYVMDNYDILRLCSIITVIEEYKKIGNTLAFYYPSSDNYNNAITRTEALSLDYMFSQFILAEVKINGIENRVVFYFGELSINAFRRLKSILQTFSFLDKDKPLTIYRYRRDQEFRKIKNDVQELFESLGVSLTMEEMEQFIDIPTILRKK